MDLRPYTYDGHSLTSGYGYGFSKGSINKQAPATIKEVKRTDRYPAMTGKELKGKVIELELDWGGTIADQFEQVSLWFKTRDKTKRTLVAIDKNDNDRPWYLMVTPIATPKFDSEKVIIQLHAEDPVWRTVTSNSDVWSITASGQTRDLTTIGNEFARPIFDFKPTAAKTAGGKYKLTRVWRNPNTDTGQAKRPQDVMNNAWDTAALIKDTSKSNQINNGAGYSNSALSFAIDTSVGGGLDTTGGMCYVTRTGEQIRYSGIAAGVMTVIAGGRGWGGTTAAALVDNDVLNNSKMVADGRDIRLWVDNVSVPYWLDGINTTTTSVWGNLDWDPGFSLVLLTAISNVGTPTSIDFAVTAASKAALAQLDTKLHKFISIDSEIFSCTTVNVQGCKVTGIKRALMLSTAASHSAAATCYFIQHEIVITYGDRDSSAPVQDETEKPIFNLATSTNTSWDYLLFYDKDALRAGIWTPKVDIGLNSKVYYGSQTADADPATELGLSAYPVIDGGGVKADSYQVGAYFFDMAGVTTVVMDGDRYRASTDYGTKRTLQKSSDGRVWADTFSIASPSSAASWANTWSQSSYSLSGTYRHLFFMMSGNISALSTNAHHLSLKNATLTLDSSTVPQLVFSGSVVTTGYPLACRLTNNDTGEYIDINTVLDIDETLRVDCDARTVTYLKDNVSRFEALDWPTRSEWLTLDPTVVSDGINTYTFDDTGTTGLTLTTGWADRMT